MPGGDGEAQYFSYNLGPAHIISFSSEFYYYANFGWQQIQNQYNWLIQDLAEANRPENRAKQPWIISTFYYLTCNSITFFSFTDVIVKLLQSIQFVNLWRPVSGDIHQLIEK